MTSAIIYSPSHPSSALAYSQSEYPSSTRFTPLRRQDYKGDMPPPSSTLPSNKKRKLAPLASTPIPPSSPSISNASSHDQDQDGEYEPIPSSSRGNGKRKVGGQSSSTIKTGTTAGGSGGGGGVVGGRGMSREAIRKANHSLIERRRREKINHALGELRDMVPGLGDAEGGKGGEFKLEVLERTVDHMKELKSRIIELESRSIGGALSPRIKHKPSTSTLNRQNSAPVPNELKPVNSVPNPGPSHRQRQHSTISPPTPAHSPDPNETDAESNLPPAYTIAARPPTLLSSSHHSSCSNSNSPREENHHQHMGNVPTNQSITSLLASIPDHPSPQSMTSKSNNLIHSDNYHTYNNPTLYLPFPTPSPTSPFLTYNGGGGGSNGNSNHNNNNNNHNHPGSASSASTASSNGPIEPSPFLAPLSGIALFGGALSFEGSMMPSPADVLVGQDGQKRDNGVNHSSKGVGAGYKEKEQEEAANLLLAFSSPDVMRPTGSGIGMGGSGKGIGMGMGMGYGQQSSHSDNEYDIENGGEGAGMMMMNGHRRRGTLESEEFVLDGGVVSKSSFKTHKVGGGANSSKGVVGEFRGKTARDILRM